MSLEGGNFYEDAIIRETNTVERQEERAAIDERLERADVADETQGGVESVQADVERQQQVNTTLERFAGLADQQGLQGFDVFQNFMLNTTADNQNLFVDRGNVMQIFNTVRDSGRFPVNEFEFQQSLVEGAFLDEVSQTDVEAVQTDVEAVQTDVEAVQTDAEAVQTDAEAVQTDVEVVQTNTESLRNEIDLRQNGNIILSLHQDISLDGYDIDFQRYAELMGFRELWSDNQIEEVGEIQQAIIDAISRNRELERNILPQAYAQGPEVYERVTRNLASLSPSFQNRIDAWEMTPNFPELPPEQMVRVSGALGTRVDEVGEDAEQSGNIFTIEGIEGTQVSYDVVTNQRSITLDGYTIEANADDEGDYQTPKLEYMSVEQENLPQLQKLISAGEALEDAQVESDDIGAIQDILRESLGYTYYLELGIQGIQEVGEIRNLVRTQFQHHEGELQDAREEYRNELIRLRDAHAGVLASRDRRVRSTLGLLRDTGITQMPQSVFLQIAETINVDPASFGFQTEIDLENGVLGFDASGDNENSDRVRFAEMVNVMLGVESGSEHAVNVRAVNGMGNTAISNRSEFDTYVAEESGWHEVGAANTILQRLRGRNNVSN